MSYEDFNEFSLAYSPHRSVFTYTDKIRITEQNIELNFEQDFEEIYMIFSYP